MIKIAFIYVVNDKQVDSHILIDKRKIRARNKEK